MSIERIIREEGVLSPRIRPAAVHDLADINRIPEYLAKGLSEFITQESDKIAGAGFLREYRLNKSLEKHLKTALKDAQLGQNLNDAVIAAGKDIWATYLAPTAEDKKDFPAATRQIAASAIDTVQNYFEHSEHEIDDMNTSYGNLADALLHRHERGYKQAGFLRRAIGGATAGIALMALVAASSPGCTGDTVVKYNPADANTEMIDEGDATSYNDIYEAEATADNESLDAPLPAATPDTEDYSEVYTPQESADDAAETAQPAPEQFFAQPVTMAETVPIEPAAPGAEQTPAPEPVPEPAATPEPVPCDQAAYQWMLEAARNDSPLSRIGKYNLSPDGKTVVSHQGIVNIAFHYGTRTDSDPANDYGKGNRQPGQWGLANQWLLDHTGRPIWKFTANRAGEFTIEDIAEENISAETLPECDGTSKVYATSSSSATHAHGQHAQATHAAPRAHAQPAATSHTGTHANGNAHADAHPGTQPAPQEADAAQPNVIVAPSGATVQYGWNPVQPPATQPCVTAGTPLEGLECPIHEPATQPAAPATSAADTGEPIVLVVPAESGEPIVIQAPATPAQPESAYPELDKSLASFRNKIAELTGRLNQTSQLIDVIVGECAPGATGNTLCSTAPYNAYCSNGNPRVPTAPGETSACNYAQIEANADIWLAGIEVAVFERELAILKETAEEAGAIDIAQAASSLTAAVQEIGDAVSGMTVPGTANTKNLTSALDRYNSAGVTYAELLREYTSTRADRLTVKELKDVFGLDELLASQPEYRGARTRADVEEREARRELAYEAYTGGMSAKRIAECLDVSKSTVYRDLKAYTSSQNDAARAA